MTDAEIMRIWIGVPDHPNPVVNFARAIAAAEREACAKVCEQYAQTEAHGGTLAEFIRARGADREECSRE